MPAGRPNTAAAPATVIKRARQNKSPHGSSGALVVGSRPPRPPPIWIPTSGRISTPGQLRRPMTEGRASAGASPSEAARTTYRHQRAADDRTGRRPEAGLVGAGLSTSYFRMRWAIRVEAELGPGPRVRWRASFENIGQAGPNRALDAHPPPASGWAGAQVHMPTKQPAHSLSSSTASTPPNNASCRPNRDSAGAARGHRAGGTAVQRSAAFHVTPASRRPAGVGRRPATSAIPLRAAHLEDVEQRPRRPRRWFCILFLRSRCSTVGRSAGSGRFRSERRPKVRPR